MFVDIIIIVVGGGVEFRYQLDVFKAAMLRNTIAHFDNGAGKTTVAVMIIKEVALSAIKQPTEKKLIIILAPTRNLVEQVYYDYLVS